MSSFATYAYCASSHTDTDDSPTSGYVINRPDTVSTDCLCCDTTNYSKTYVQIPRNESNFVWTSHNLVVELDHMTYWFWNAPKDAHGTTQNALSLRHPKSYKKYINKPGQKERAQWTRVFVIPTAVGDAVRREDRKAKDCVYLLLFMLT
jgi:hypothetical protein